MPLLEVYLQLNASIKELDKIVDKQITDDVNRSNDNSRSWVQ